MVGRLQQQQQEEGSAAAQGGGTVCKRAHSCHVNILDTRTFSYKKVVLEISADASEPVLGTSLGCAQVSVDFQSLRMFKSSQTVYSLVCCNKFSLVFAKSRSKSIRIENPTFI